jgi:hypothetical protein
MKKITVQLPTIPDSEKKGKYLVGLDVPDKKAYQRLYDGDDLETAMSIFMGTWPTSVIVDALVTADGSEEVLLARDQDEDIVSVLMGGNADAMNKYAPRPDSVQNFYDS